MSQRKMDRVSKAESFLSLVSPTNKITREELIDVLTTSKFVVSSKKKKQMPKGVYVEQERLSISCERFSHALRPDEKDTST